MSVLNATIGRDRGFAVMSADTAVWRADSAPSVDSRTTTSVADAARSTFLGDGTAPDMTPIAVMSKIIVIPHLNMLVAGVGFSKSIVRVAGSFIDSPPDVRDIRGATERGEAKLVEAFACHPGHAFNVVALGWVVSERQIVGYAWSSADSFDRVEIEPGHTMHPIVDTDDADYSRLHDSWQPALEREGADEFHRLLLQNQYRAFRAGKLAAGTGIGGDALIARLNADGISVVRIALYG